MAIKSIISAGLAVLVEGRTMQNSAQSLAQRNTSKKKLWKSAALPVLFSGEVLKCWNFPIDGGRSHVAIVSLY